MKKGFKKEKYCLKCNKKLNIFNTRKNFSDYYCSQCFKKIQKGLSLRQENNRSTILYTQIIGTYNNAVDKKIVRGAKGYILAGALGAYIGMLSAKGDTTITFVITYDSGIKETKSVKIGSSEYVYLIRYLK